MAPMLFTKAILSSEPIRIFNNGDMYRDFTYIDDVSAAVIKLLNIPPKSFNDNFLQKESKRMNSTPYRIVNIGNGSSINLMNFIETLEEELNIKAIKVFDDMQLGDVEKTYADISYLKKLIDYEPNTPLKNGVKKFVKWYRNYYRN